MCKCANFALQSVFAMDLQCAIKVQQQRAQLKILFEGSFATFPPPTSALVEKIQQPGTWEAASAGKLQVQVREGRILAEVNKYIAAQRTNCCR